MHERTEIRPSRVRNFLKMIALMALLVPASGWAMLYADEIVIKAVGALGLAFFGGGGAFALWSMSRTPWTLALARGRACIRAALGRHEVDGACDHGAGERAESGRARRLELHRRRHACQPGPHRWVRYVVRLEPERSPRREVRGISRGRMAQTTGVTARPRTPAVRRPRANRFVPVANAVCCQ
jgi:hypothetical protein